jgi:tryptophan-rich sensory protein
LAFLLSPLVLGLGVPALFSAGAPSCITRKSCFQPPGWVFGVVWTILYTLFGIATFMAWRHGGHRMTPELWASIALLAGLIMWPVVFSKFCAPELAFAATCTLTGLALSVTLLFLQPGFYWSAILTAPLVAWLYFASFLAMWAI